MTGPMWMARRTIVRAIKGCVAVLVVVATWTAAVGRAQASDISEKECWNALNELAAAVVFSDLSEEEIEGVYTRLDRLQDQCSDRNFKDAMVTIREIETVVGK